MFSNVCSLLYFTSVFLSSFSLIFCFSTWLEYFSCLILIISLFLFPLSTDLQIFPLSTDLQILSLILAVPEFVKCARDLMSVVVFLIDLQLNDFSMHQKLSDTSVSISSAVSRQIQITRCILLNYIIKLRDVSCSIASSNYAKLPD